MKYISPKGEYVHFRDEEHYAEMGRVWGLFKKIPKKTFQYKGVDVQEIVTIVGYEEYMPTEKDKNISHVAILAFPDGNLHCILPAFLKEMQASKFSRNTIEEGE